MGLSYIKWKKKKYVKLREFEGVKIILINDEKVIWKNVNKINYVIFI